MGTCLSIYEQTIWPIGIASEPLAMRVIAPRERWNYELLGATCDNEDQGNAYGTRRREVH